MQSSAPELPHAIAPPHRPAAGAGTAAIAAYGMLVLIVATVFAALDRQILVLLAEPMRQSLRMSDTQIGLLQGAAITLVSGVAALPIGWLADRYGRRAMLAACVLVWAAATGACGLAQDFTTLFVAAAGLGIGEAGLGPIVYGLIPQIVSARRRVLANGVYALAAIFGGGLGLTLSGAMVKSLDAVRPWLPVAWQGLEPWRLAFLAVAIPGPLVALTVLLIRLHPWRADRQPMDALPGRLAPFRPYRRQHGHTMATVFGGVGLATLGVVVTSTWLPIIATRHFGASIADVGQGTGLATLLGTAVGALAGAAGAKLLGGRLGVALPVRVISVGSVVAALATAAMPLASQASTLYVLLSIQVASLIAGSVLIPTLLQDMTPEALRSRVIALGTAVTVVISSLSPVLVGLASDLLRASPAGLLALAAALGTTGFVLGAWLMFVAERPYVRTVHAVHPELARGHRTP